MVRHAQGLVHMGKRNLTVGPYHSERSLNSYACRILDANNVCLWSDLIFGRFEQICRFQEDDKDILNCLVSKIMIF